MRIIKYMIVIAFAAAVLSVGAGCETVKGLGKDIEGASTSVQQAFVE